MTEARNAMSHASYTPLESVPTCPRGESYEANGDSCECKRVADDVGQTEPASPRGGHVVCVVGLLQGWRVERSATKHGGIL